MKKCHTTIKRQPLKGFLDGHTPFGNAPHTDFRVLLNTEMVQDDKFARRPGWQGLMRDMQSVGTADSSRGNRDLHDQLLELTTATGDDNLATSSQREAINLHFQTKYDCGAYCFVACTRSRIYASTGSAANWRILLDGAGPSNPDTFTTYGQTRWMSAQLGNYLLFTNDYDPVMYWKIGDPPEPQSAPVLETEPNLCYTAKSVFPVFDLATIGILRAGCICAWSGFVFVADVDTVNGVECDSIYWSSFNDPLLWIPGEEITSGFVSLSRGEKVLRMEPLAGQLRIYTDRAIYNVTLVGGEEIFRFNEIYRGPDALAYRFAFANLGDSHVYISHGGIVELRLYDAMPNRIELLHKASGLITKGLDGRLLNAYPGPFTGFGPFNRQLCNQIVGGYDNCRREVWFSWPTVDKDILDSEGIKRMSLVISRLYKHATLVDHGFSSFCNFVPREVLQVRDWMVMIGACTEEGLNAVEHRMCKEGKPYNVPDSPTTMLKSVVNGPVPCPTPPNFAPGTVCGPETGEDPMRMCGNPPQLCPPDMDSLCASEFGKIDVLEWCSECQDPCMFSMASLHDFCLKEQVDSLRVRETFVGPGTTTTYVYWGNWQDPLPGEWLEKYFRTPSTGRWAKNEGGFNSEYKPEREDTYELSTPPQGPNWWQVFWFPTSTLNDAAPWLTAKVQGFDFLLNPGPGQSIGDLKVGGIPGKLFVSIAPNNGGFTVAKGNPIIIT